MQALRGNAWAELRGLDAASRHHLTLGLSIILGRGERPKQGARFGSVWLDGETWNGSLFFPDGDLIPAGLVYRAQRLLSGIKRPLDIIEMRTRPAESLPFHCAQQAFEWRPYQNEIHEKIIEYGSGVVVAPPRAGKTAMAARAVDTFGVPTVYVAPSLPIVRQTYEVFRQVFGENMVGRMDGESKGSIHGDIHRPIVIATAVSASRAPLEWWQGRHMLVIDEFHHAAADTYHQINQLAGHIFHRLCFTGTHFRTGDDAIAMEAIASDVLAEIRLEDLVKGGYIAMPRVFFLKYQAPRIPNETFSALYRRGIVDCQERNEAVVRVVNALMEKGDRVLVLTKQRGHADRLGMMIENSVVAKGGEGVLTSRSVRDFLAGRYQALVGTTVIGEGVDVPAATALVYASGGSATVQLVQSYFRPMTAHEGKDFGRIYDFVDAHNPVLKTHSEKRADAARRYLGADRVQLV